MNLLRKAWQRDEGSIDLVQLIAGLLIIGIAAVGTFQSLFYGYEQLDYQMRYRKAVSVARSYAEYWQGRIHTDMPTGAQELSGNLNSPHIFLLDERDPTIDYDDVFCEVRYGEINDIDLPTTGKGVDFWEINVNVSWWEPNDEITALPHEISFHAAMVPAAL